MFIVLIEKGGSAIHQIIDMRVVDDVTGEIVSDDLNKAFKIHINRDLVFQIGPMYDMGYQSLERIWENSALSLLRMGHSSLVQLVMMAWYGRKESWAHCGYPGPPTV